ncbi:chymotrypsin-like elastase family member 2A [Arctopsyche grandis]|uniref:chymotrypsin-like elastase family member 2A n=1 Tax=Arctopsyche grandis TaxID=121162 RepID=UPI00406D69DD
MFIQYFRIPKKCTLPEYPENGSYLVNDEVKLPGSKVSAFTVLIYSCNEHYKSNGTDNTYCKADGTWKDAVQCIKTCKPLNSLTVDLQCTSKGLLIDCNEPMPSGTKVAVSCKQHHVNSIYNNVELNCDQGSWDHTLPSCESDCGLEVPEGTGLILGGRKEMRKHSPWNVGIFHKNYNNQFEMICGGNIISRKFIISTAVCFSNSNAIRDDVNKYAIAAGKYYRDWNNTNDEINEQKTKVVGWGITRVGDLSSNSNTLKRADISVITYDQCRESFKNQPEFLKYVTPHIICAGAPANGTTVCNGDSGAGLVFPSSERGQKRWYLTGLVSVGSLDDTRMTCANNSYTIFTNIYKNADFIHSVLKRY